MKKNILFIANPISGTKGKINWQTFISRNLDLNKFDWELYYTQSQGDATIKTRNSINKYDFIIAIGGDGTINEVAQGLIHTETCMGIIPNGSGNGFANHLHIPNDPDKAILLINTESVKKVDTGLFNKKLFLNVAGMGFDAKVAKAFDSYGKRGFLSYILITLKEFRSYLCTDYKINIDGQTINRKAFLLTIANGSEYGNHAKIAPKANIQDGKLDIIIIKPLKNLLDIISTLSLFTHRINQTSICETLSGRNILIKSKETSAQIDGEPIKVKGDCQIEILPSSLKILAP